MKRRNALATVAVVGILAVAGCSSGPDASGIGASPSPTGTHAVGVVLEARTAQATPEVEAGCTGTNNPADTIIGGMASTLGEVRAAVDGTIYQFPPDAFHQPADTKVYLCVIDGSADESLPLGITRLMFMSLFDGVNTQSEWVDAF